MAITVHTATIQGLESHLVAVEVEIVRNLSQFVIVGLPDAIVNEAKERVRSAIKNSGAKFPPSKVIANLAPAPLRKAGSGFDLPLAVAVLAASGQIALPESALYIGELALDGAVRPVSGVLSLALLAKKLAVQSIFVPAGNADEAALVNGLTVYAVDSLQSLLAHCLGQRRIRPYQAPKSAKSRVPLQEQIGFGDIIGHSFTKRALAIAAAGRHNVLLWGSPGGGKTLLAKALVSILPPLRFAEALEITQIYSVAGLLPEGSGLIVQRPFRAPHHSITRSALIGGGSVPRPGELSLAHHGVLFLDEVAEFHSDVLQSLRQPLEERCVTVTRAHGNALFPANIMLVSALNPCPCGFAMDPRQECTCTPHQIMQYQKKISGPLLDRIDLFIEVPTVATAELGKTGDHKEARLLQEGVTAALAMQKKRFAETQIFHNAEISQKHLRQYIPLDPPAAQLLSQAAEKLGLSARGYFRVCRVARTIADFEQAENVHVQHINEALQYRQRLQARAL